MGNTTHSLAAPPKDIKFFQDLYKGDIAAIKKIQTSLDLIFPEIIHVEVDGKIGPETTKALNEFCSHFEIKQTDNLRSKLKAALFYYGDIAKTEPAWEKDTQKQNFICWLERQLDRHDIKKESLKLSNPEAPQRLILLRFFKHENPYLGRWSACDIKAPANENPTQPNKTDKWIASYRLTADKLNELETKNQIIEKLQDIKNKQFSDKNELKKALEDELKSLIDQNRNYDKYISSIVQHAEKRTTYQLPAESLIKLKFENIPEPVLEQIRELSGAEYQTEDGLKNAVNNAVAKGIKEGLTDNNYQNSIYAHIQPITDYELTEQSLKKVKDEKNVPEEILEQLKKLEGLGGIEYSSKDLFFKALTVLVNSKETMNTLGWFLEHEAELEAYNKIKNFFEELCTFEELINKELSKLGAARNEHYFDDPKSNPKSVDWSGGSCGCVLDDLAGTVYGFYPFWLAQEEEKPAAGQEQDQKSEKSQVQMLNFSVLTRVGYYALPINEKGELIHNLNQITGQIDEFKKIAHKFRTKVDMVIYHSDWQEWRNSAHPIGSEETDKFTTNIVKIIKSHADGVTIDFDGYPQDAASFDYLIGLIKELRKKLNAANENYFLNIIIPMHKLDPGSCAYRNLENLVAIDNNQEERDKQDDVDLILVPIAEPTKEMKKMLRQRIENSFTGEHRRKLLRKIVPVITPRGKNYPQLKDDIIYFKDNFGGVGLWPLATGDDNGAANTPPDQTQGNADQIPAAFVSKTLKDDYRKEDPDSPSFVCKIVCPNKWWFRYSFDMLSIILIVYVIACLGSCKIRNFTKNHYWYVLVPGVMWILIGVTLLFCDPYLEDISEGNWPLVIVLGAMIIATIWIFYGLSKRAKQP
jgi:hypothetical protein